MSILDHGDVELPRQAEDRQHGQQGLGPEALAEVLLGELTLQLQEIVGAGQHVAHAVEHAPGDVGTQRHEGAELDHRLEGDGMDQALVVLGGVGVAGAEQDREQRHDRGDVEGGIGEQRRAGHVGRGGQHREGGGYRLQLQGDVGQRTDQRHQAGEGRQRLGLAVARGDEVGDRGDVLTLGDADHLGQYRPEQQEGQQRADEDTGERPARGGGLADGAVVGPGGAIDGQRQAVDDRAAVGRPVAACIAIAAPGNQKQDGDVKQRDGNQQPAWKHEFSPLTCGYFRATPAMRAVAIPASRQSSSVPDGNAARHLLGRATLARGTHRPE